METVIAALLEYLERESPGGVVGVYLYGSGATSAGLRPDSDIDVLVLTRRSLNPRDRGELVSLLLRISGWRGHGGRFPEAAHRRPVELTSLVVDDLRPLTGAPRRDFQYGEWLRGEFEAGRLPGPARDPDVVVLLATAQAAHRVLSGPALGEVVGHVPPELLRRAVLAVVPDVLAGVEGDERNALLTLARVVVTVETGRIVSKDAAAEAVAPTLGAADRELLERARAGYLGVVAEEWAGSGPRVAALARALAERAGRRAGGA
ncbi:DUF4111 domain-containing protein [Streptomyces sp. OF3]|uniref:DUF4111 domain-containing protein n=2 Tax=Streptomyces alkaliterrae TaxID=2213162 RepID=A0A7W3ZLV4_9ACTN|nr:DUF4111 domain-containing protein [Streptomyces alkaliterrae]MBB1258807.1 DUF4111 domain-containing protein [Streptomyces alkaliterrae]